MSIPFCFAEDTIESLTAALDTVSGPERADVLNRLAKANWYGSPSVTLKYSQQAKDLAIELKDSLQLALAWNSIGVGNYLLGEYEISLDAYLKSLAIHEALGNQERISGVLSNIANLYVNLSQYDKALGTYEKSLDLAKQFGDEEGVMRAYNNMGWVYRQMNQDSTALTLFRQALGISRSLEQPETEAFTLNNIGEIYSKQKKYTEALFYFKESLRIIELQNLHERIAWSAFNIGQVYLQIHDTNQALHYLNKSLKISKSLDVKDLIKQNQLALSELYESQGNMTKALQYFKAYKSVNDSIFNETSSQKIAEMQTRYENKQMEKEMELLKKNEDIQEMNIKRQQLIIFYGFIGFSLVLMFTFLIAYQKKRISEHKEELEEAMAEIKKLSGLLPICAHCKKIRDDEGYWEQIESFIASHSEARFSHGICPECAKKYYGEYYEKMEKKTW